MILNKGQVLELPLIKNVEFVEIQSIEQDVEQNVMDLTTSTGFFIDIQGIVHKQCGSHSVRAIAMYGLGKYFSFDTFSTPAKHAVTLVGHINTFLCSMAKYYAGALGMDFVNIYFAPYVEHLSKKERKQIAQYLIFSLSQSAFSRGGQVLFTDFNVHLSVPEFLKKVKAVGPGGKILDRTYGDFEEISQEFLLDMLDVWKEGDANGMPFPFPKCDLHITGRDFDGKANEVLDFATIAASVNGSPYFIFDSSDIAVAACCRLKLTMDEDYLTHPERSRFCGFQNVSINLPQCAYRAKGDISKTIDEIKSMIDLGIKAHFEKIAHMKKISKNPGDPMYELLTKPYFDGDPYIQTEKATYLIGLLGLNEAVQHITGEQLHTSHDAYNLGKDIVIEMYNHVERRSKEVGLKISLEESPAESAVMRLAKEDARRFPDEAIPLFNGSIEDDNMYYTNSIHLRPDAPVDALERIRKQAEFHPIIKAGAITHIFVGEKRPSPMAIKSLVKKTLEQTDTAQMTISPEFTFCNDCGSKFRGILNNCPKCGSGHVTQMTRIVGYYSKVENWNKSKKQERIDRSHGDYVIKSCKSEFASVE